MRRYISSHWLFGLIFAISVLLVVTIALRSSKGADPYSGQDQVARIVNETESLHVEGLTITDPRPDLGEKSYVFTLKNISNKEIVAWAIQNPSGQMQYAGATMGGGLAPGESRTVEVYDASGNRVRDKKIIIKLAMFADGSSEGDFQAHQYITDSREGSRIQTERINAIIEKALIERKASPNQPNEKEWLDRITSAISELSETAPPDRPMMAAGMNSPKQSALRLIAALGDWEETRHKDPVRAGKILKERDAVIVGTSDLTDGLSKIVRHNEWLIGKQKANKGGSNEK
jgi:hypothetical protein